MVWEASLVALVGGYAAVASVVVLDDAHEMKPLLAFVATHPDHQHRGLGSCLIEHTIFELDRHGIFELHLAVDPANPARRLYERQGFIAA